MASRWRARGPRPPALARGLCAFAAGLAVLAAAAASAGGEGEASRGAWHRQLGWPPSLCPLASPRPGSAAVDLRPIDERRSWVVVVCQDTAGSATQLVYLRTADRTRLLVFPQYDASRAGAPRPYRSSLLEGSLSFGADAGVMHVLRPYRGIGDCGQRLSYQAGAAPPRLMALRVRECPPTLDRPVPPEQWPLRRP